MSFNKIILIGNLGRDPELRYTPQGVAVTSFTMATNEKKKDSAGEMQDITTWFKVTLWRNQAENAAKYLVKGSPVYIEGRLRIEEWTDRENNNRYTLDVQASEMQFISAPARNDRDDYRPADQTSPPPPKQNDLYSGPPAETSAAPLPAICSTHNKPLPCPMCDDDIPF